MKKLFVILVTAAFCFGTMSCVRDCKCVGSVTTELHGKVEVFRINQTVQLTKSDCAKYEYLPIDPDPEVIITVDVICTSE